MINTKPSAAPITLSESGQLFQNTDGEKVLVATYDAKTGHLEYESLEVSKTLKRGIAFAIGTINKGKSASGLSIKTMSVKGQERDVPSGNIPPRPKKDRMLGDNTPAIVEYDFRYFPRQAYINYEVFLDSSGEPVRRNVRRLVTRLLDDRDDSQGFSQENRQTGKGRWEKGAVMEEKEFIFKDNQIIARRATHMTFTPNEVVGGFDASDDSDDHIAQEEAPDDQ
jgi:hypothetical protein